MHYSTLQDRCKSLESQLYKVKLLEGREQELTGQLKEKSNQVIALATRIAVSISRAVVIKSL